eukprot:1143391-Pelagomonas_calceolata.AAC.10
MLFNPGSFLQGCLLLMSVPSSSCAGPISWPMLLTPSSSILLPLLRLACPMPAIPAQTPQHNASNEDHRHHQQQQQQDAGCENHSMDTAVPDTNAETLQSRYAGPVAAPAVTGLSAKQRKRKGKKGTKAGVKAGVKAGGAAASLSYADAGEQAVVFAARVLAQECGTEPSSAFWVVRLLPVATFFCGLERACTALSMSKAATKQFQK